MSTPYLDLGRIYGDSAFEAWCKRQDPVLDSTLTASWLAFLADIKGETGDKGEPGADGLTEAEVDARVVAGITGKQDTLSWDDVPVEGSINPVKSGGVFTALSGKQDALTFDATPTDGSSNPVTSGGVHAAIAAASIGDTGWVSMTRNPAVVSSGEIKYRVKNGVLFLSGSFTVVARGSFMALTTSEIPAGFMPSTEYGTRIRVPALSTVWRIADVYFMLPNRKLYMSGVLDIATGAPLSYSEVTVTIDSCSWVLPAAS